MKASSAKLVTRRDRGNSDSTLKSQSHGSRSTTHWTLWSSPMTRNTDRGASSFRLRSHNLLLFPQQDSASQGVASSSFDPSMCMAGAGLPPPPHTASPSSANVLTASSHTHTSPLDRTISRSYANYIELPVGNEASHSCLMGSDDYAFTTSVETQPRRQVEPHINGGSSGLASLSQDRALYAAGREARQDRPFCDGDRDT